MNDDGGFLTSQHERMFLILAFVIPMLWLVFVRMEGMPDGETANDAYYHIAMAERGPAVFTAKKFPALELSVWRDHFADKELLYHFMLCGLVRLQKIFVPVLHAPFHFPAFVFITLLILSLLFAMKRFGVSPPLYLPMTMLALMSAPNVMFRVLMLRPHVFSLTLMLVLCGLLARGSLRWKTGWALVISLVYTWSYSNPQFIVIPVLFFALSDLPANGWKSLLPAAGAVLGVFLGLLIHPQFPNSFIIWKVQSIDALFGPLLSEGARTGTQNPVIQRNQCFISQPGRLSGCAGFRGHGLPEPTGAGTENRIARNPAGKKPDFTAVNGKFRNPYHISGQNNPGLPRRNVRFEPQRKIHVTMENCRPCSRSSLVRFTAI